MSLLNTNRSLKQTEMCVRQIPKVRVIPAHKLATCSTPVDR